MVLRWVKGEVVQLVVAMHDPHTRFALVPRDELAPHGYFAHQLAAVNVYHGCLGVRHLQET